MPFQKGHRLGVGNNGNRRPRYDSISTPELIAQLNEVDKKTGRRRLAIMIDKLIDHACGRFITVTRTKIEEKKGWEIKTVEVDGPADLEAAREIIDRTDGRVATRIADANGDPQNLSIQVIETVIVDPSDRHKLLEHERLKVVVKDAGPTDSGSINGGSGSPEPPAEQDR